MLSIMEPQMRTQKRRTFIINCIYFALIFGIVFLFFRYAIHLVMPFVIALLISLLVKPLINWVHTKIRINRNLVSILTVLLFYGTVGVLAVLLVIKLFDSAKDLLLQLPSFYTKNLEPSLNEFFNALENSVKRVDPSLVTAVDSIFENLSKSLGDAVSSVSMNLVGSITKYATSVPGILINILITIISTFFITTDYYVITSFLSNQIPEKTRNFLFSVKRQLGKTLGKYIRSYALVLLITFSELFIGLSIIRISNALLIAAVIAFFDILPIIGSGLFLIPWSVISLVQGEYLTALGLILLYIVITIIRNIIEPKIIGTQVGLHPIVTLVSMIVGAGLFGGFGLVGLPVTIALIKNLDDEGIIHVLKRPPLSPSADAADILDEKEHTAEENPQTTDPPSC